MTTTVLTRPEAGWRLLSLGAGTRFRPRVPPTPQAPRASLPRELQLGAVRSAGGLRTLGLTGRPPGSQAWPRPQVASGGGGAPQLESLPPGGGAATVLGPAAERAPGRSAAARTPLPLASFPGRCRPGRSSRWVSLRAGNFANPPCAPLAQFPRRLMLRALPSSAHLQGSGEPEGGGVDLSRSLWWVRRGWGSRVRASLQPGLRQGSCSRSVGGSAQPESDASPAAECPSMAL